MKNYDVVIIGAGSAGLSARKEVAAFTDNYLVVDDGPLGTTCARIGCMPSKVLIEAANIYHQRKKFPAIGVEAADHLKIDYRVLMQHVRTLRDRFVRGVLGDLEEWSGTHLRRARACLVGKDVLQIGDEQVTAKKIILATGSSPTIPPAWDGVRDRLLTTDTFFELETLPAKMAVIGMGAIGLELSQALARVGVEVTSFGDAKSAGGLTDPEMVKYARETFARDFSICDERVTGISAEGESLKVTTASRSSTFGEVLCAVGRTPNLKNLGLEMLGVKLDEKGQPPLDPHTFRITGTEIYLVGDANAYRPILHEASYQGRVAGLSSVEQHEDKDFRTVARLAITFTSPQIAVVGESHKALLANKADFVHGSVSFEGQGRALTKLANCGLLKVYGDRRTGRLLGAEIFAPEGEHLAHLLAWTIDDGWDVFKVLRRPFYHPVIEEGLRTALRRLALEVKPKPLAMETIEADDPPAGTRIR